MTPRHLVNQLLAGILMLAGLALMLLGMAFGYGLTEFLMMGDFAPAAVAGVVALAFFGGGLLCFDVAANLYGRTGA